MRLTHFGLGVLAAAILAPAALAFTSENRDASGTGQYVLPKFDVEEQAKNFRRGDGSTPAANVREIDTPFGKGTLQFGVQQRSSTNFGSAFSPSFGPAFGSEAGTRASRSDYERMLSAPGLQHRYDR